MHLSLLSLLFISKDQGWAISTIFLVVIASVILGWLLATRKRGGGFVLLEDFESYKKLIAKEQKEQNQKIQDLVAKFNGIKIPDAFDSSLLERSVSALRDDHDKKIAELDTRFGGINIPSPFDSSLLERSLSSLRDDHDKKIAELDTRFSGFKVPDNSFDSSALESSISSVKLGQEENDKALDEVAEALKSLEREKDMLSSKDKSLEADLILIKNENERLKSENIKLWEAIKEKCSTEEKKVEAPKSKEDAILDQIAAKRSLINFSSIGESSESEKDDLKLIKGIGPFIEKKLNALGIWTFAQVSAFKPEDVESVTKAIEFFPGRISRDNWVSQAGELKK